MRTISIILQSTIFLLWILPDEVYGQTIDQSLCYNSLYNSDTDSDGRLQTDEYVDFISTISDGYITNDQEYSDLSSVLKVNFSHLSSVDVSLTRSMPGKIVVYLVSRIMASGSLKDL